ncbi:MAG: alpha/beta hydrolase [Myxococcales bacterium]|nr:alpha/beta hydrolase [Myxococcales bacterium]
MTDEIQLSPAKWEVPKAGPKRVPPVPTAFLETYEKDGKRKNDGRVAFDLQQMQQLFAGPKLLGAAARQLGNGNQKTDEARAIALMDLAVTGRAGHAAFKAMTKAEVRAAALDMKTDPAVVDAHVERIWKHCEALIEYLEAPEPDRASLDIGRDAKGKARWIAVNAEVDPPWRPVNVGASSFRTVDVPVTLPSKYRSQTLEARAVVAGDVDACEGWILFLHGGGSRAEECEHVAEALLAHPHGKKLALVSPDLPGCGYGQLVDPTKLGLDPTVPLKKKHENDGPFPFLDLCDAFVEAFVDAIRADEKGLKDKPIAAVVGGSLGANLSLRMAKRGKLAANAYIAWSPASIWAPVDDDLGVKNMGGMEAHKMCAAEKVAKPGAKVDENTDMRRRHFWMTFERATKFVETIVPPTVDMWWYDAWPTARAMKDAALADRAELYSEHHRQYVWRYSYEQLFFSWQHPKQKPRRETIPKTRPLMLLGAKHDNFNFANIYDRVVDAARGKAPFPAARRVALVGDSGHSLHDERPRLLVEQALGFLASL